MANIMVQLQKLANQNTQKTFKFNSSEALKSRDWQEEMSNTAHQREVKDLVAAGLNPVLSSGGSGAQSYTTSSASGTADSAVNAIGNVKSAQTSAAATRYAASVNAAAMQNSAAMQLEAAKYQAKQSRKASQYQADKQYDWNVYNTDNNKSGSWAGLTGRLFDRFGFKNHPATKWVTNYTSGKSYQNYVKPTPQNLAAGIKDFTPAATVSRYQMKPKKVKRKK